MLSKSAFFIHCNFNHFLSFTIIKYVQKTVFGIVIIVVVTLEPGEFHLDCSPPVHKFNTTESLHGGYL